MRILFCLSARMGDVLTGIPAFIALREKYPDADLNWLTLEPYKDLIPKCGKVITENNPPFGSIPSWAKVGEQWDIVIKAQPMWRHKEWEVSRLHLIDCIAKWSGVNLKRRSINVDIPKSVIESLSLLKLPNKPFVTLCCSPCYSCRNWPLQQRMMIVEYFRKINTPIITVGGKDGQNINGVIPLHGKLNYLQTIAVIGKSRLYVGPDTGCTWLSCAAHNTAKLCFIDKNRLKTGVVGYEKYLNDKNIKDVFYQEQRKTQLDILGRIWKNGY